MQILVAVAERDWGDIADLCLYLPLGVLLSVLVIEVFSAGRKGADLDKAVVLLLGTASSLFFAGGVLTFTQLSGSDQQAAVRGAGFLVILGVAAAVVAMLKQQCYLQKLVALAKAKARRRASGASGWTAIYGVTLVAMLASAGAVAWMRPDRTTMPMRMAEGGNTQQAFAQEEAPTETVNARREAPERVSQPTPQPQPTATNPESNDDLAMATDPEPEPELESEPEPTPETAMDEPKAPATSEGVTVTALKMQPSALNTFRGSVVPMLRDRCVSCHGPEKQKGGLRVDSPEWIRKGGDSGPVVIAFQPEKSYLYTSTVLPADDPDIMPAKGKPLTSAQTRALKGWITGGAPMGDGNDRAAAAEAVAAMEGSGGAVPMRSELAGSMADALTQAHIQFNPVDGDLFEIDCSLTRNYPESPLDLEILRPIASKIHTLDVSRTSIQDADLAVVSEMKALRKLLLARTKIGDDALQHLSGCERLEILNLYGTNVSDEGLKHLTGLSQLKKLYLWNSRATSKGGDRLKRALPKVEVNVGQ